MNLIEQHKGYVWKLACKYSSDYDERQDYMQEGFLGILQAEKHFDPSRGVKFLSFAHKWIDGRMKKHLIRHVKAKGMTGRNETFLKTAPVYTDSESSLHNLVTQDTSELRKEAVGQRLLQAFSSSLNKQNQVFFHRRYRLEISHPALARLYQTSEKKVKHREQNLKRWFRKFSKTRSEVKEYCESA